ncbi:hypothetical protein [Enterococcus sp. LJL90]
MAGWKIAVEKNHAIMEAIVIDLIAHAVAQDVHACSLSMQQWGGSVERAVTWYTGASKKPKPTSGLGTIKPKRLPRNLIQTMKQTALITC